MCRITQIFAYQDVRRNDLVRLLAKLGVLQHLSVLFSSLLARSGQ
jgi:hypothetical protein